jgi:hypothetical protein
VERLSDINGAFPQACFACSARIYIDGGYCCDPGKLDDKSVKLNVARYRPLGCPSSIDETGNISAEILLRKILGK